MFKIIKFNYDIYYNKCNEKINYSNHSKSLLHLKYFPLLFKTRKEFKYLLFIYTL